jgi:hypothetical protein
VVASSAKCSQNLFWYVVSTSKKLKGILFRDRFAKMKSKSYQLHGKVRDQHYYSVMGRTNVLKKLLATAEIIEDECEKHHAILANELEQILKNGSATSKRNGNDFVLFDNTLLDTDKGIPLLEVKHSDRLLAPHRTCPTPWPSPNPRQPLRLCCPHQHCPNSSSTPQRSTLYRPALFTPHRTTLVL